MELRNLDPNLKILLSVIAASLVSSGALVLVYLFGGSTTGGASLSLSSLAAAVIGVVVAAPFAGIRSVMWGREVRDKLPAVNYLLMKEYEYFEPVLHGMSDVQAALVLVCEVLPPLLMVLPAAQSGLTLAYGLYVIDVDTFAMAAGSGRLDLVSDVPAVASTLALLTAAALAATGQLINVKVSQKEVDMIREAMTQADRFYRLTASGTMDDAPQPRESETGKANEIGVETRPEATTSTSTSTNTSTSTSTSSSPSASASTSTAGGGWQALSAAFQDVGQRYIDASTGAANLAGVLTAAEVIYLSLLWQFTDDLAAPFASALTILAVDIAYIRKVIANEAEAPDARRVAPRGGDDDR